MILSARPTATPTGRRGHAAVAALFLLSILATCPRAHAASTDDAHAAVCRCANCRDASRCCCSRTQPETAPSPTQPTTAPISLSHHECDAPMPPAVAAGVSAEHPLPHSPIPRVVRLTAHQPSPRDTAAVPSVRRDRVDRPPRQRA